MGSKQRLTLGAGFFELPDEGLLWEALPDLDFDCLLWPVERRECEREVDLVAHSLFVTPLEVSKTEGKDYLTACDTYFSCLFVRKSMLLFSGDTWAMGYFKTCLG